MTAQELYNTVKGWGDDFGVKLDVGDKSNAILRRNIKFDKEDSAQFFGYIRPEEQVSGGYCDLSYVVFPQEEDGLCILAIGIGSEGFRNDNDLAALPGIRRQFLKLLDINNDMGACKTSFLDRETDVLPEFVQQVSLLAPDLLTALNKYKKDLPIYQLVNPDTDEGQKTLKAWLALYALLRGWGDKNQKTKIDKAIREGIIKVTKKSDDENVLDLVKTRKYVVLQGAPGTGKTFLAKETAKKIVGNGNSENVIFTQFHAETSYSNFIYGIKPKLNTATIGYESNEGDLFKSIELALNNPDKKIVLIIDEINRANLATVLGPVFYLFEYQMQEADVAYEIVPGKKIKALPPNLYVIATMNTADRSLAVVDFALRRRFAWYTLTPTPINFPDGSSRTFFKEYFEKVSSIFELYATDEELNLQPGQGYFIAKDETEMKNRLIYEIMPLIKEYFAEGLILNAKDSFTNYFYQKTEVLLYK
jgi:5-methylcytosine-specific restriction protein B